MVDSSLFLEEVRKIARNQFKIETARKDRVDKLEKDNIQLREEIEKLKKKIKDHEEQSRKRQAAIKELRVVHDNAKKGIFRPEIAAGDQVAVVSPVKAPEEEEKREDKPFREPQNIQPAVQQHNAIETSTDLVAQAQANTVSRSEVANPCRWARSGECRFGTRCRYSHNILPDSYCPAYNASAVCRSPNCRLKHALYSYNALTSTSPSGVPAWAVHNSFAGSRTPPQDVAGAKWK